MGLRGVSTRERFRDKYRVQSTRRHATQRSATRRTVHPVLRLIVRVTREIPHVDTHALPEIMQSIHVEVDSTSVPVRGMVRELVHRVHALWVRVGVWPGRVGGR